MSLKNYRIHRDLDREGFTKAFGYTLVLIIFFAMVLLYICQSIQKVRIENEVKDLVHSRTILKQVNHRLRLERGVLRSLTRVDKEARYNLGLIEPETDQLIFLQSEFSREKK